MSRDGGERTRRRFVNETLAALGAGATVGLAGCSGDDGSDSSPTEEDDDGVEVEDDTPESTETPTSPDVDHVNLTDWPQEYLVHGEENSDMMFFDSWSPQQMNEAFGVIPLEGSYIFSDGDEPYARAGLEANEIPETFFQYFHQGDVATSTKVDQLPGGIEASEVADNLRDNGYEKVGEAGEFDVYSKTAADSVHGVKEGRHAIAANMFAGVDVGSTDTHRSYLERVLNESTEDDVPEELNGLRDALEIKDTFGASSVAITGDDSPFFVRASGYDESYQPSHAATTVDIDEGLKYAVWLFEDESTAERTYSTLSGENYRNGWENLERDGRVMKAAGEIDLGSEIEGGLAENQGMLVRPEI